MSCSGALLFLAQPHPLISFQWHSKIASAVFADRKYTFAAHLRIQVRNILHQVKPHGDSLRWRDVAIDIPPRFARSAIGVATTDHKQERNSVHPEQGVVAHDHSQWRKEPKRVRLLHFLRLGLSARRYFSLPTLRTWPLPSLAMDSSRPKLASPRPMQWISHLRRKFMRWIVASR